MTIDPLVPEDVPAFDLAGLALDAAGGARPGEALARPREGELAR